MVRYVALPIVGIGIVKAAHHVGFVGSDSLYRFVLLIQYSLPPAMAIGMIIYPMLQEKKSFHKIKSIKIIRGGKLCNKSKWVGVETDDFFSASENISCRAGLNCNNKRIYNTLWGTFKCLFLKNH